MAGDPAILKRTRACPFARGGRVLVRFRANGHSLFARRSGEPLARLRLTGNGDRVVLLYPSHRGGWGALGDFGASATPLDDALQCLSDNPYFLELRQTYGRAASAYRYAERRPFPGNYSYNTLRHGMAYADPGASYYEERYRVRVLANLKRRAKSLGYVLQEAPSPA